jgi:hypothetical protein
VSVYILGYANAMILWMIVIGYNTLLKDNFKSYLANESLIVSKIIYYFKELIDCQFLKYIDLSNIKVMSKLSLHIV